MADSDAIAKGKRWFLYLHQLTPAAVQQHKKCCFPFISQINAYGYAVRKRPAKDYLVIVRLSIRAFRHSAAHDQRVLDATPTGMFNQP